MAKVKLQPKCDHCGSEKITATANATWDFTKQAWIAVDIHDDLWCEDCEGECRVTWWRRVRGVWLEWFS